MEINSLLNSLNVLRIDVNTFVKDRKQYRTTKVQEALAEQIQRKNSLIREKIKEMEILNYMDELKLDKEISNQVLKSTYSRIGINSKEAFLRYIQDYNVNINTIFLCEAFPKIGSNRAFTSL